MMSKNILYYIINFTNRLGSGDSKLLYPSRGEHKVVGDMVTGNSNAALPGYMDGGSSYPFHPLYSQVRHRFLTYRQVFRIERTS